MDLTSKNLLKLSLAFLHVILTLLVFAVLRGRESPIIATIYSDTLNAIILNLGAVSGNKLIEMFLTSKYGAKADA